ncbi:hypothetical protein ACFY1A_46025 [Streptomyces sp. NPDC001520]|uniref:hypothetical protein n=1 Tax=Streptomyces sp. NPDC001520 TaxID=3364581 RepID=UPI003680706A
MSVAQSSIEPHQQFLDNIAYADGLVAAGPILRPDLAEDLYRAAWVQAVSALDHWVHLEVYKTATSIVSDANRTRPPRLEKFPLPWKYIERIHLEQERLRDVFREALEAELGRSTFQNQEDIGNAFQLILADKTAGAMWTAVAQELDMTKAEVTTKHKAVLYRRNKIAHESDIVDATTGQRRPITQAEASDAVGWIKEFVRALKRAIP